jgi:carbon-monoxide dehydrogenase iron sulfur subunit
MDAEVIASSVQVDGAWGVVGTEGEPRRVTNVEMTLDSGDRPASGQDWVTAHERRTSFKGRSTMRTVFVNPERCIGCLQCELACAVEHSASRDESVAFREVPTPRKRVHVEAGPVPGLAFPNRCRHCDPAPCLNVCPTGAIVRDAEIEVVLVDAKRCIGCAMCAVVCPFDVLTFHPLADGPGAEAPVAVKCDGCADRLRAGEEPACSEVCKVDALVFGELNDLMDAGRVRETSSIFSAIAPVATAPAAPDHLAGWRRWGAATVAAGDAAEQINPRRARLGTPGDGHPGDTPDEAAESEGAR